ncbi:MAG TPA: ABC transporter permease [Bacteroidetes bacterium]|nr:ABC transporter permease [Bacteroidota bacterium]
MRAFFAAIGRGTWAALWEIDRYSRLVGEALFWLVIAPLRGRKLRWRSTVEQMVRIGVDSVPIVSMISFFVGLILGMQAAYQLKPFGVTIYMANLVGVSVTRELGPMLTAIVIAGRSGSAIAAEIGTMKVSEEIDALRTMGLNPVQFLVVPRLLAMLIMLPALTVIADVVSIIGGTVVGVLWEQLDAVRYINQTATALVLKDIITGLFKSGVFALLVATIGCYQGFSVAGGAEGVGKRTTASVVVSIFMIIAADMFFTMLFYSTF